MNAGDAMAVQSDDVYVNHTQRWHYEILFCIIPGRAVHYTYIYWDVAGI